MNVSDRIKEFLNKKPSKEQKKLCNDILKYIEKGELENIPFSYLIEKVYISNTAIHIMFKEDEEFEELQIVLPALIKTYCFKHKETPLCRKILTEIFKIC